MSIQSNHISQSIYKRGADDGLLMGILLSITFLAAVNSIYYAWTTVACLALAFAVPFLTFYFLRRSYRFDNCRTRFSALWLQGICIFFFGSLLAALTSYIYLRLYNPSYISTVIDMAKEVYQSVDTPDARQMAAMMQKIQDTHMLPTPAEVAVQIVWSGVFTGSLLSVVVTAIVRATSRPLPPPPPSNIQ